MNNLNKNIIYFNIFLLLVIVFITLLTPTPNLDKYKLNLTANYLHDDIIQLFYKDGETLDFAEELSITTPAIASDDLLEYSFEFDSATQEIRLDFGSIENNEIFISNISLEYAGDFYKFGLDTISDYINDSNTNQIKLIDNKLIALGNDPYMCIPLTLFYENYIGSTSNNNPINMPIAVLISILLTLFIYKFVYLKDIIKFIKNIISSKTLLKSLAINDFKVKFAGSYFGVLWAFVQPIMTIVVFWFVFEIGFKSVPVSDVPFALWLSCGLIPWFFFSDALNAATNTFFDYGYLVKKVVFKIDILPLVKIISTFFVHLFFIAFLLFLLVLNGISLNINMLFVLYYAFCMIVYVTGLAFITASIAVFFKDITQIISICLQFGMWLAPIMWNVDMFSAKVISILKLNPIFYIIEGYRNCFLNAEAFVLPSLKYTVYFWGVTTFVFMVGISLFRRLKVHFADVL